MLHPAIRKTIVLSLKEDHCRRGHIRSHFTDIGISNFSFFIAIDSSDKSVAEAYRTGLVKCFPSCFRCGEDICSCPNNILIPQQVANWLSFIEIWKSLKGEQGYFLICEDDVSFHKNSIHLLNEVISDLPSPDNKVLLRLVASGKKPNLVLDKDIPLIVSDKVSMSNAGYIVSGSMVNYILESFEKIEHTSDVWLHSQLAKEDCVTSLTVKPLIGTDLSFNTEYAQFLSRIHPKGIDASDVKRKEIHIKRVQTSDEYQKLKSTWLSVRTDQKESYDDLMFSSVFDSLKSKQYELIKKIAPDSVKRNYTGQMDALYQKEYGFSHSFEQWESCDADGNPIPWMTYSAVYYLSQLDLSEANVFEWGCGGSSHYFSERALSVTSIESNVDWYDHVYENKLSNNQLYLKKMDDYASCILEGNGFYNIVSIDGDIYRRLECAVYAIQKLKPGGIIIVDNSDWLEETCSLLREQGFTQIDFAGPGPINGYMWCTSIFFKNFISIPSAKGKRPAALKTGIKNERDLPLDGEIKKNIIKKSAAQKGEWFTKEYPNFKKALFPPEVDVFSSQEGEDILIKRLLKRYYHKNGFYVDIGAHHPIRFSNTYHYYLKGWRGINVDPRSGTKEIFERIRPRDINLECGVANQQGEMSYYEFQEPAFNTFCTDAIDYAQTRTKLISKTQIPVMPLWDILERYLPKNEKITFLNIDVEGLELDVIKSSDWNLYRPKIVCLEALDDVSFQVLNEFMESVKYLKVASTKNSFFFCEQDFWDEVK